jgi:hypothetical protein
MAARVEAYDQNSAAPDRLIIQEERVPKGTGLAVLAGLVLGYPFWAFDYYRRLSAWPAQSGIEPEEVAS